MTARNEEICNDMLVPADCLARARLLLLKARCLPWRFVGDGLSECALGGALAYGMCIMEAWDTCGAETAGVQNWDKVGSGPIAKVSMPVSMPSAAIPYPAMESIGCIPIAGKPVIVPPSTISTGMEPPSNWGDNWLWVRLTRARLATDMVWKHSTRKLVLGISDCECRFQL